MAKIIPFQQLYNWLILFFLLSFQACMAPPIKYGLTDEKFVSLLTDVHVSEHAIKEFAVTQRDSIAEIYYQQIFEIHQISELTFKKEMRQLKRDPEKLNYIYDLVIENLEAKKEETFKKSSATEDVEGE